MNQTSQRTSGQSANFTLCCAESMHRSSSHPICHCATTHVSCNAASNLQHSFALPPPPPLLALRLRSAKGVTRSTFEFQTERHRPHGELLCHCMLIMHVSCSSVGVTGCVIMNAMGYALIDCVIVVRMAPDMTDALQHGVKQVSLC